MIKIFYHSSDLDGHCSGAIVKYKYPEAELFPINYNQKFPWEQLDEKNDTIIMVDFSLQPFTEMVKLYQIFKDRLILIDHHISTINDLNNNNLNDKIKGIRKVNEAACELTWQYFFPEREIPEVVKLLGRYDVWDHSNSDVLPFQYGIRLNVTYPKNQDLWKAYFEVSDNVDIIQKTIEKGKIILEYQKQENEKYAKSCAFEIKFEGYRAICANKLMANSQLFDSVWDSDRHDLMIQFGIRKNGIWTMSFYTKKDNIDCSEIAKKFGGGGHAQAAGASFKDLPKEFITQIKYLQPIEFSEIPKYGNKLSLQEFIENVNIGVFIDSDGYGYYATDTQMTDIIVLPSMIINKNIDDRWSHIVWFNR